VFSLKWSAMSAAFGFILSLLLGLVSGVGALSFLRALIFGAGFFLLGSLLYWMVKRFLPELGSGEEAAPVLDMGSQVDISLGADDDVSSLAEALREESIGDEDTPLGLGLDQDGENGYTNNDTGLSEGKSGAQPSRMAAVVPAEGTDVLDVLPGLDSPSQAFSASLGDMGRENGETPVAVAFPAVKRNSLSPEEGEEFKGKEKDSALAIQTILKRD
jgi:hypothetical protein